MKKYGVACLIIASFILCIVYYNNNKSVVRINKNKLKSILYIHETDNNKIESFDMTNDLNKEDINSIVKSLDNGVLRPDELNSISAKNTTNKQALEYIELLVLGDRSFNIYKVNGENFTVMYPIDKTSNGENTMKHSTINSKVLQAYFIKFKDLSRNLTPNETWEK